MLTSWPPELRSVRLAVPVQQATLRVHEPSLLLSWALGDGTAVQLRAGSAALRASLGGDLRR